MRALIALASKLANRRSGHAAKRNGPRYPPGPFNVNATWAKPYRCMGSLARATRKCVLEGAVHLTQVCRYRVAECGNELGNCSVSLGKRGSRWWPGGVLVSQGLCRPRAVQMRRAYVLALLAALTLVIVFGWIAYQAIGQRDDARREGSGVSYHYNAPVTIVHGQPGHLDGPLTADPVGPAIATDDRPVSATSSVRGVSRGWPAGSSKPRVAQRDSQRPHLAVPQQHRRLQLGWLELRHSRQ